MIEPRDIAEVILKLLGIFFVCLAFRLIKIDFPLNFLAAAFSLLLGLAALSAE